MSTINITGTGADNSKQIPAGQYLLAVTGVGGGDTAELRINLGDAKGVVVTDSSFTDDGTKVVWLPACTVYIQTNFETDSTFGAALAVLSTKLEDG